MEDTLFKQPFEEFDVEVDFVNLLPEGGPTMTITSVTSKNADTGAVSTTAIIKATPAPTVPPGTAKVVFWLASGQGDEEEHVITVKVEFSGGQKREMETTLRVRSIL